MITARPLSDWSEAELKDLLAKMTPNIGLQYADILSELDRRSAHRQARTSLILSALATVAAAVAAIAAAVAAIAALLKT
jgi:hypothetical protein